VKVHSVLLTVERMVQYAQKQDKRGLFSNMAGVLWLPGLLAEHPRAYSVSRGPPGTGFWVHRPRIGKTAA
jgi:hypothetical protein